MSKRVQKLPEFKEKFDADTEALSLSWKDELIVIVLLLPIPINFLSTFFTDETMRDAWANLELMPEWYQHLLYICLLYTSPSPRDRTRSRMPSSA